MSFEPEVQVLHWLPGEDRWDLIPWTSWTAFRAPSHETFLPLAGVESGIHHFLVCFHDAGAPVNLIPHKYLIEPDGRIGPDNFAGWTREDRRDYARLMTARSLSRVEEVRLNEIRYRVGDALYPPKNSVQALMRILPERQELVHSRKIPEGTYPIIRGVRTNDARVANGLYGRVRMLP